MTSSTTGINVTGIRRVTAGWTAAVGVLGGILFNWWLYTGPAIIIAVALATNWRKPGIVRQLAVLAILLGTAFLIYSATPLVPWQWRPFNDGCGHTSLTCFPG